MSGLFALLGASIGGLISYLTAARAARAEERRHLRELALKVALTKFEGCQALAQQLANATGNFQPVPPLDEFILQAVRLMDIAGDSRLSAAEATRRLRELSDFARAIREAQERKP